jgi:FKBP-type peptidyl-prolyl cis-trans isomerase
LDLAPSPFHHNLFAMSRQPLRSFFVLLFLGACLLTLALVVRSGLYEVKTHDEPINAAMRAAMAERMPELTTKQALELDDLYSTATVTPSRLRYLVRRPGTGPRPAPDQEVAILFAGRVLDGDEFDSNFKTGTPLIFRVHTGAVIPGLDEAVSTMRLGEKRTVIVPYWLGFPPGHQPRDVPEKSTLIFEVERVK